MGPHGPYCLAVMNRVSQPSVRVWVCFPGVTPAVHTSTQLDGVRSMANPSHLLKVSQWPGSTAFTGGSPWGQASQGDMGILGVQTTQPLLVCRPRRFPSSRPQPGRWHTADEAPVYVLRCSIVVSGQVETRGGPKLSVQTQMFLLPCTLDFMVHEKIVALIDVSQVPVCLAQAWLVLQGSRTF